MTKQQVGKLKTSFPRAGREENFVQLDGNASLNSESESATNGDENTSKDDDVIENEDTEDESDGNESESESEEQYATDDEETTSNDEDVTEDEHFGGEIRVGENENDKNAEESFSDNRKRIPVITGTAPKTDGTCPAWHETYTPRPDNLPSARKTIRQDRRLETGAALPSFSAPNCRSLGPKLNNFQEDMQMRSIDVALCSETWEKSSNKKFQKKVENMLEMKGLKMISNPRKYQRGGGVCIIADLTKVDIQAVEVSNPDNVEAVFAIVKPKTPSEIKEIITFAFYSPPRSKKKSKLIDHLVTTIHSLLSRFPRAGVMGGGDRNCLNISPILAAIPRMQNVQQLPTLKGKNLDVLLTTMAPFYSTPIIVPPVMCDDPNKGVPSDHSTPVLYPVTRASIGKQQIYKERTTRPLPDSAIRQLGQALIKEDWAKVTSEASPNQQDAALQLILTSLLDLHCPTKTVKLRPQIDKPFMTVELKKLDRQRKREYKKHGKSEKYRSLTSLYNTKFKRASADYLEKIMLEFEDSNPGKANKLLKRLGAQPGDVPDESNFTLPKHQELGLCAEESADRIAQKFADISQEFPPIKITNLPERVQAEIMKTENVPFISRQMVETKIEKAKTTKGGVAGDLPAKLMKEFSTELAPPLSALFRNVAATGKWPERWKLEQGLPLKKKNDPLTEDDLRIISLTPFSSKVFEQIVLDWLLKYVSEQLDPFQYGGRKGTSINHYLIDLISFILINQDLPETRAVLTAMVDFSKAFNRQNHHILITKLCDMGVPGWLLKIVIGFLEERKLIVTMEQFQVPKICLEVDLKEPS